MSIELKRVSRKNYDAVGNGPTSQELIVGTLQRIADSQELLAKSRDSLENENRFLQNCLDRSHEREGRLRRQVSALKGHITRIKRQKGGASSVVILALALISIVLFFSAAFQFIDSPKNQFAEHMDHCKSAGKKTYRECRDIWFDMHKPVEEVNPKEFNGGEFDL